MRRIMAVLGSISKYKRVLSEWSKTTTSEKRGPLSGNSYNDTPKPRSNAKVMRCARGWKWRGGSGRHRKSCVGIPRHRTPVAARERRAWHKCMRTRRTTVGETSTKKEESRNRGAWGRATAPQLSQGSRKLTSTTMNGESMRHPVCIDSHRLTWRWRR